MTDTAPPFRVQIPRKYLRLKSDRLLVEAKAHIGELKASCKAEGPSRDKIKSSLDKVKSDMGIDAGCDWLKDDYQYANRLAMLWFLRKNGVHAHLLFIYFYGDWSRPGPDTEAPDAADGWQSAITQQMNRMGLRPDHSLVQWTHTLFLPVVELEGRR